MSQTTTYPLRLPRSLKEAVKTEDVEQIQQKTQALAQASMKLGEAMYKAQQAGASGESASAGGGHQAKDDVIDAEFREVDDDKKKS